MASQGYGYDEEFIDEPPEYLKCIVCSLVLRDPLQLVECGHHYCSRCFDTIKGYSSHYNSQLSCPIDRQVIDLAKVLKDRFVERVIADLHVKCKNDGCTWVGELRDIEAHRSVCVHAVKGKSLQQLQYSGEETGVLSTELLKEFIARLEKCEEHLVEKDKDLAFVKFQLKETKEKLHQRDEVLKQKLLNSEEAQKLHGEDVVLLKKEVEERKVLQLENERTVENKGEINDVCASNKEEIDEPRECAKQIRDNDEENKEVKKKKKKKKKKKAEETQNNSSQSDLSGKNDDSNEGSGTGDSTKQLGASQCGISRKIEVNYESAWAGTVTKEIDSLIPNPAVPSQNQQNEFIWRTNVKEWKRDEKNFSPSFTNCCAKCVGYHLTISVNPTLPMAQIDVQTISGFPDAEIELETNRGNATYNFNVELLSGNISNIGSGRKINVGRNFASNRHFSNYGLGHLEEHSYTPFIFNDFLTIKCTWTCQHYDDDCSVGEKVSAGIDSLILTPTVAPNNERNKFIWRTNVKEWKMNILNFSPSFDCCSKDRQYNLTIWVYPGLPMIRLNLENNRCNAIYNFVVELLAGNRSSGGSRKKICSKKVKSYSASFNYELCHVDENVYKAYICNDILTIKCTWTCQHFASDDL